uniref:Toll-like receptor 12.2 n=1 Tax=Littorina littorea TaxID=31216 RepID=A0A7G8ZA08_LITLI|nr:toll-like receptor 12.2 [Littorina littorea]
MNTSAVLTVCVVLMVSLLLVADTVNFRNDQTEQRARDTEQWTVDGSNRSPDQACYPLCRCHGDEADCSRNYGRLAFVPKLPDRIRFLNFSLNNLTTVPSDEFFLNVTHITSLSLENNGLKNISPGAFRPLQRLTNLSMCFNDGLTYDTLSPVLGIHQLEYLDLRYSSLPSLPPNIFVTNPLRHLKVLYLHGNFLGKTNRSVFAPLRDLEILDLANNGISVLSTNYLPVLLELNVGRNGLSALPRTCTVNGSSLFPSLVKMFLENNGIDQIYGDVCLPRLNTLELSNNLFGFFYTDHFNQTRFPRLQSLYLSSMHTYNHGIQKYAFRNPYLSKIYLMFNGISFGDMDDDSFAGCPNLQTLQLNHNVFDRVDENKFVKLFGNLTNLQRLYICGVGLQKLSAEMLSGFKSLNKLLLYNNKIRSLPDGVVDSLLNLTVLDLGSNQISVVRQTTFSPAMRQGLQRLDLSGNPFYCSCDLRWFQSWLASSPKALKYPYFRYTCSNLPDTNVTSFFLSEQACLLSRDTNVLMVSCLSLLLVVMTTVFPLYRYRWHLRLMLHEAVRGGGEARRRRLQRGQFQYDVYVSYASDDLGWVRQHLLAELENWGLRLCLHDRDFLIGNNIVDDISHSVESSKKVLVVFSRHYSRNQWCQFELNFCLRHVMDFGDNLVVTCLNDVESRDMTTAMMAVLKMMSYIRWDDDPEALAAFWGRLRQALQEILPAEVQP